MTRRAARLRRAQSTRLRIQQLKVPRLAVFRSNKHIYAQIFSALGDTVLVSSSSLDTDMRDQLKRGGDVAAASVIGADVAKKAKEMGIIKVAFDRSGYRYHGRVKALAESARLGGLDF